MSEREAVQRKADEILAELRARGIPALAAMEMDCGAKIGVGFQLENERAKYGCRLPVEEATADRFAELYEAVR